MKMRKWKIVVFLLLVGIMASIALAKTEADRETDIPKSPALYPDFIGENSYNTASFDYRTNQDVPICFLIDFYNFLHDEYDNRVLTWRINDTGVGQQSYVYAYPSSFLGRWSPQSRRQLKFIASYEAPKNCSRSMEELHELFPVINVRSDPSSLSPTDFPNQ